MIGDNQRPLRAPPANPLPENAKQISGDKAHLGYEVLARAERGQARRPLAQRDPNCGPWGPMDFSDR